MSLQVRNSKTLIDPDNFKFKALVIGLTGVGKTQFLGTVPNIGVAACETGQGSGLLTIASQGIDFIEPSSLADLDAVCKGMIFKDKSAIGLDSLSDMYKTFIKQAALAIPRKGAESEKRLQGIPELDDYGVMAEMVRRLLRNLLVQDKHILVTAGMKIDRPDPESGQTQMLVGPDLPGQMFLNSPAMFDIVLFLRSRPVDLRDKKNPIYQRYFMTAGDGTYIAKCRSVIDGVSLLDKEEVFDLKTGQGTFPYLLAKIQTKYAESLKK